MIGYTPGMNAANATAITGHQHIATRLIEAISQLAARGWTPATSSNFSCRIDAGHALITASGGDKGRLTPDDFLVVDMDGQVIGSQRRSSAETLLHTQLYRRFPEIGCVLHTHSHNQTVASRLYAKNGALTLAGYELLKAFSGHATHEGSVDLPVLPNTQDMPLLAARVEALMVSAEDDHLPVPGYLIEGHGLYAWGRDISEAMRHLEAIEFMIGCELDMRRLGG